MVDVVERPGGEQGANVRGFFFRERGVTARAWAAQRHGKVQRALPRGFSERPLGAGPAQDQPVLVSRDHRKLVGFTMADGLVQDVSSTDDGPPGERGRTLFSSRNVVRLRTSDRLQQGAPGQGPGLSSAVHRTRTDGFGFVRPRTSRAATWPSLKRSHTHHGFGALASRSPQHIVEVRASIHAGLCSLPDGRARFRVRASVPARARRSSGVYCGSDRHRPR